MKKSRKKTISFLAVLAMLVSCVSVMMPKPMEVKAETLTQEEQAVRLKAKLGEGWTCIWNENQADIADADYVEIVSTEKHNGAYSLRIGHPTKDTNITLQRAIPVSAEGAYEWSGWLKREGDLKAGSAVYIKNGPIALGGDCKGFALEAAVAETDWTEIKNTASATDMWINCGTVYIDIAVVCKAGSYLYIDDLNVINSYDPYTRPLMADASFERWTCTYNGNEACDAKQYVKMVEEDSRSCLRIGHETQRTSLTLSMQLPLINSSKVASANAVVKLVNNAAGNGIKDGTQIYIKSVSANDTKAVGIDTTKAGEWQVLGESAPFKDMWAGDGILAMEIVADLEAGAYLYVDSLNVYADYAENNAVLNVDTGFDTIPVLGPDDGSTEKPDTPDKPDIPPTPPTGETIPKKLADYPTGWERWAQENDYSQVFVTGQAHTGNGALAFVNTKAHGSSMTQIGKGLEDGEYTLSAWVKSSGGQSAATIEAVGNDKNKPGDKTVMNLQKEDDWKKVETTLTVTSGTVTISLFVDGKAGNWLVIDDVMLVKNGETANRLVNGDFEGYKNVPEFQLPPKVDVDENGNITSSIPNGSENGSTQNTGSQNGDNPKTWDDFKLPITLIAVACVAFGLVAGLMIGKSREKA